MTDRVENIPILRTGDDPNRPSGRGFLEGEKLVIEFADSEFANNLRKMAEIGSIRAFTFGIQFQGGVGSFVRLETS